MTVLAAMFAVFGIRLLLNKRRHAAEVADVMIVVLVGIVLCSIMLDGLNLSLAAYGAIAVFLVVMQSYLDPFGARARTAA